MHPIVKTNKQLAPSEKMDAHRKALAGRHDSCGSGGGWCLPTSKERPTLYNQGWGKRNADQGISGDGNGDYMFQGQELSIWVAKLVNKR